MGPEGSIDQRDTLPEAKPAGRSGPLQCMRVEAAATQATGDL